MPKKEHQCAFLEKHIFGYIFDILVTLSGLDLVYITRKLPRGPLGTIAIALSFGQTHIKSKFNEHQPWHYLFAT